MGIFDRFNRVLKSNLNSLVDRAEDPAKLLDQTVVDMETELKRAKRDLVTQLGTAKRLEKLALHPDFAIRAARAGNSFSRDIHVQADFRETSLMRPSGRRAFSSSPGTTKRRT